VKKVIKKEMKKKVCVQDDDENVEHHIPVHDIATVDSYALVAYLYPPRYVSLKNM
jgi:hypothetical protein